MELREMKSLDRENVASAARVARAQLGWSLDHLAEQSGKSRTTVGKVVQGEPTHVRSMIAVLHALGLTIGAIATPVRGEVGSESPPEAPTPPSPVSLSEVSNEELVAELLTRMAPRAAAVTR